MLTGKQVLLGFATLIGAPLVVDATGAVASRFALIEWVFEDIYLNRVQVIAWAVLGMAAGAALVWWMRKPEAKQDTPAPPVEDIRPYLVPARAWITVVDRRLNLSYTVTDPRSWPDDPRFGTPLDNVKIAGPFHAAEGCAKELLSEYRAGIGEVVVNGCTRCEERLFLGSASQHEMQEAVFAELNRALRAGETIEDGMVLGHLDYWSKLRNRA